MVAADEHARLAVIQERARRTVAWTQRDLPCPSTCFEAVAVGEYPVDKDARAEAAERLRQPVQRARSLLRNAVAPHERHGIDVVAIHGRIEVGEIVRERRDRRYRRTRALADLPRQPDVVVVLVCEDDQLDIADPEAERGEGGLEVRPGLDHQRPRVDQRERVP
jgi:hypothetical protein